MPKNVAPTTVAFNSGLDIITIVRDPSGPLGKRFSLAADGRIEKQATVNPSVAHAEQRHVPDAAALAALLREVADDPHAAIINAAFPSVAVGTPFLILSEREIKARLGLADRTAQVGVHELTLEGTRYPVVGRFKENVAPSNWQLFDRDVDAHTPERFASLDYRQWLHALGRIVPGITEAALVRVGSTSARVRHGGSSTNSINGHTWAQLKDGADCERLRTALLAHAADADLTWLKPRLSRQQPGRVIGHSLTTIADLSVLTPGRLVFNGRPTLVSGGLELLPPDIEVINGARGRLDTGRIPTPDKAQFTAAVSRVGASLQLRDARGALAVDEYNLRLSTELELEDGRLVTVAEASDEVPKGEKLRCQAPFRDSVSFAGVFRKGADGRPCVHDVGTGATHWLCDDDFLADQFSDLDAQSAQAVREIELRIAAHELVGEPAETLTAEVETMIAGAGHLLAEHHTQALMQRLAAATGQVHRPRFTPVPASEFAAGRAPGWIVKGVLPRAELAVIYGASGSGKSFFTLDLVACVARGEEWRGQRVQQGPVVYIAAEGAGGFRNRLKAYANQHAIALDDMQLSVIADAPNLIEKDHKAVADAVIGAGGASVIVVDTLAQTTPGANENAAEDMGRVIKHCKEIHHATGALILIVHHSGKDEGRGARGWSGIRAAVDAEIEISQIADTRIARLTKQKDGEDGKLFAFKLNTVLLDLDEYGDPITSCVVEYVEHAPQKKREPRGQVQQLVYQAVLDQIPLGGASARLSDIVEQAVQRLPRSGSERDKRADHVKRALKALHESAFLRMDDETVTLPHAPNVPQRTNGA